MNRIRGFSYIPTLIQLMTLFLGGFFFFVLGVVVYDGVSIINPTHVILQQDVPRSGGSYTITNNYTDLKGLTVTVPFNAYTRDVTIQVKEYPITDTYQLPDTVTPISPIIELTSDLEDYTRVPVTITVPIDIDVNSQFAMGFFWNGPSDIEAVPITELTNNSVTIKSLQYKKFFISVIDKSELIGMATGSNAITTGYEPGEDDWPFANRGSALTPNGHCAGQTLTSMYYYMNYSLQGEEPLYTAFDNDTPDFWFDDADGYRLSSAVQNKMSFTSEAFYPFTDTSYQADYLNYHAFLYAMYATGNPQFMALYAHNGSTVYSGHAMLVYKAQGGNLYVADPNFPGSDTRFIPFSSISGYATYSSGNNANDITQIGTIQYDTFAFLGLTSFVDFDIIAEQYTLFEQGTVAQFSMPTLAPEMAYLNESDVVTNTTVITNGLVTIPGDYGDRVGTVYQNYLVILLDVNESSMIYTVYIDGTLYQSNIINTTVEYALVFIPFADISGPIGIFAEQVIGGTPYYADFYEFTVE